MLSFKELCYVLQHLISAILCRAVTILSKVNTFPQSYIEKNRREQTKTDLLDTKSLALILCMTVSEDRMEAWEPFLLPQ